MFLCWQRNDLQGALGRILLFKSVLGCEFGNLQSTCLVRTLCRQQLGHLGVDDNDSKEYKDGHFANRHRHMHTHTHVEDTDGAG